MNQHLPLAKPKPAARPLSIRIGRALRGLLDRAIRGSSRVPNDPLLDQRLFPWTERLAADWEVIRDEAVAALRHPDGVPLIDEISPDHEDIAPPGKWRSFFLVGYGIEVPANLARCPATARAVAAVPGLNSAFFSILAPGAHITPHRGVTKGLLTCHLGLIVPPGPVWMRVRDDYIRWAEGAVLLFDDTWEHEVWNDTEGTRVVLLLQFERPLRAPGRWIARGLLGLIRRSRFVRDAQANMERWDAMQGVRGTGPSPLDPPRPSAHMDTMLIETETTPNPATLKFLPGRTVMETGTRDFATPEEADASPLAAALFSLGDVVGVFFGRDFVSITIGEGTHWRDAKADVLGILLDHFSAQAPLFRPGSAATIEIAGDAFADDPEDADVIAQIKDLIETRVRPAVANDGGDIVYRGFDRGTVYLTMQGACAGCPSSSATLKQGIEQLLKHYVPEVTEVRAA